MFLSRLAPRFDVALRDVRSTRQEFRLEAAQALAHAASEDERGQARAALRPLLDDDVARVRAAALTSLGFVGDDADVPALLRATRDERPLLRETAAVALGRIAGTAATDALVTLLDASAPELRYQAIVGLSRGAQDAPDELASRIAACLTDTDSYVREAAASALASFGDAAKPHAETLARLLADEPAIALAAAHALAAQRDARAIPCLRQDVLRGRPTPETLHHLVTLHAHGPSAIEPIAEDLFAIVRRFIAPRATRLACAGALAALGDARGVQFLEERLRSFFVAPRLEALAYVASFRVVACAPAVAAMVERPRGVPLDVLAHTLERLDTSEHAQAGLASIDHKKTSTS